MRGVAPMMRLPPRSRALPPLLFVLLLAAGCHSPTTVTDDGPGPAPEGMVWVPAGTFRMGAAGDEAELFFDAGPQHDVELDGFWMDSTEVTNAQFQKFVEATGYKTVAERPPDPRQFPGGLPPEARDLKPFSIVFKIPPADAPVRTE